MIQNIIFDIGNVLVTFDPYTYFLKYPSPVEDLF